MTELTRTSNILLFEEINTKNQNKFALSDLVFATPVTVSENDRNTKIRVNSSSQSQYAGWQDVWYNRLDIGELFNRFNQSQVELIGANFTTIAEVLTALNLTYGLAIQVNEVVDVPVVDGDVVLTMVPGCLAFTGSLIVKIVTGKTPIDSVLTVQILDGLWYPDAVITNLIHPVVVEGMLVGNTVKLDGSLLIGTDVSADDMLIATNNELEVAIRANPFTGATINPIGDQCTINLADTEDWEFPVSISLIDTSVSDQMVDLYDIRYYVKDKASSKMVEFSLKKTAEDDYHFVSMDSAQQIFAAVTTNPTKSVAQQRQQVKAIATLLTAAGATLSFNSAGAALGEFEIGVVAYRRNSMVPRVAAIVNVSVLPV